MRCQFPNDAWSFSDGRTGEQTIWQDKNCIMDVATLSTSIIQLFSMAYVTSVIFAMLGSLAEC